MPIQGVLFDFDTEKLPNEVGDMVCFGLEKIAPCFGERFSKWRQGGEPGQLAAPKVTATAEILLLYF